MKLILGIIVLMVTVLLSSCNNGTKEESRVVVASVPKSVAMPVPVYEKTEKKDTYMLMVRSFLYPKQKTELPFNLIFFPKKPVTKQEKEQYLFICSVWQSSFPYAEDIRQQLEETDNVEMLPIYWLLIKQNRTSNCSELVKNYDYSRAQLLASRLKIDSTKTQLVSQLKSNVIVMDLGTIYEEADLILAINVWRQKMCPTP